MEDAAFWLASYDLISTIVGWVIPVMNQIQSSIKMYHRLVHRSFWWGHFLNQGSSKMTSACRKLTWKPSNTLPIVTYLEYSYLVWVSNCHSDRQILLVTMVTRLVNRWSGVELFIFIDPTGQGRRAGGNFGRSTLAYECSITSRIHFTLILALLIFMNHRRIGTETGVLLNDPHRS